MFVRPGTWVQEADGKLAADSLRQKKRASHKSDEGVPAECLHSGATAQSADTGGSPVN